MKEITWVLVMDGTRAQIYQHVPPAKELRRINEENFTGPNLSSRHLEAHHPAHSFDSLGGQHQALEPSFHSSESLKYQFVRQVVDKVDKRQNDFDRLVLIAPPKILGSLRKELPTAVARKTVLEINKDLTQVSPVEVASYLQFFINPPLREMIQTG